MSKEWFKYVLSYDSKFYDVEANVVLLDGLAPHAESVEVCQQAILKYADRLAISQSYREAWDVFFAKFPHLAVESNVNYLMSTYFRGLNHPTAEVIEEICSRPEVLVNLTKSMAAIDQDNRQHRLESDIRAESNEQFTLCAEIMDKWPVPKPNSPTYYFDKQKYADRESKLFSLPIEDLRKEVQRVRELRQLRDTPLEEIHRQQKERRDAEIKEQQAVLQADPHAFDNVFPPMPRELPHKGSTYQPPQKLDGSYLRWVASNKPEVLKEYHRRWGAKQVAERMAEGG